MDKNKKEEGTKAQFVLRNHNGTVLYQGPCVHTAAIERKLYEYHMQVKTTLEIEWVKE